MAAPNTVEIAVRYVVDQSSRSTAEATSKALANVDFSGGSTLARSFGDAGAAARVLAGDVRTIGTETDKVGERARDASGRFLQLGDGAGMKPLEEGVRRTGDEADKAGRKALDAGGMFSKLGDLGKNALSFAAGNLLAGGISGVAGALQEAVDKGSEFRASVSELQAITGVSGPALENLAGKARELAVEFGGSAVGNVTAFKGILSKLGPDIATTPAALEQMTRAVNTLSAATGDSAEASMDALTTGILQFQIPLGDASAAAAEMTKQMNVMAAGAQQGAAEVPDVADAIKVAGVAASGAKVSFEETNAAIQALAAGGKVGAEAGTALRNVLGKLGEGRFLPKDVQEELGKANVDIKKLADTTLPFTDRLRELQKISGDAALTTKLFGTENAAAASILIRSVDDQDKLRIAITGTNTATEQAAVNQSTFAAQMARTQAQITDAAIGAYQAIEPALKGALSVIGGFVQGAITGVKFFVDVLASAAPILLAVGVAYVAYTVAVNAGAIATGIATAAQTVFNAVMAANPIGLVIAGILAAVAAYKLLADAMSVTAEEQLDEAKAEAELIAKKKEEATATQAQVKGNQQLLDEYTNLGQKQKLTASEQERFSLLQKRINETYPGLIDNTKAFSENLSALSEQSRKNVAELGQLSNQLSELDKQAAKNRKTQLALEINVSAGNLSEVIDDQLGSLGGLFLSDKGREVRDEIEKFKAQLYTDKDTADIENKTQRFIGSLSKFEIPSGAELKIRAALQDFSNKRVAYLKALSGAEVPEVKASTDAIVDAATPAPEKVEKLKSLAEEIGKVRAENAKLGAENARAVITDSDRKELQALQDSQAAKLAELRTARDKVATLENTKAAERATLQKAYDEQILLVEAQGLIKREELIDKLAQKRVAAERKAAEDVIQAEIEARERQLSLTEISAETGSVDAVRRAGELRLEILQRQNQLEIGELVAQNSRVQAAQIELQEALLSGAQAQILVAGRNLALAQREALTGDQGIADALLLQGQAVTAQTEKNAAEVARVQIEADTDLARRSRDLAILEAKQTLQEKLRQARGNKALELQAEIEFVGEQRAAQEKYLRDTNDLVAASLAFREGLYQAYLDATSPDESGDLNDKRRALEQEEADLKASFDRREIMYEDYLAKSAVLEQKRQQITEASVNLFEVAQKGAVASLNKMAEQFGQKSAKAQEEFANLLVKSADDEAAISAQRLVVLETTAQQAGASLAAYAVAGELTWRKFGQVVVDGAVQVLQAQIPIWVAAIFGQTIAQMGPLGIATAAAMTATLYGLAAAAKSALGRFRGEVNIKGPGTTTSDDIPRYLSVSESVVTAAGTLARGRYASNEDALQWLNSTGRPLEEYFLPRIMPRLQASLVERFHQERYVPFPGNVEAAQLDSTALSRIEAAIDRQTQKLERENAQLRMEVQQLQKRFLHSTTVDLPPVEMRMDGGDMVGLIELQQRERLIS